MGGKTPNPLFPLLLLLFLLLLLLFLLLLHHLHLPSLLMIQLFRVGSTIAPRGGCSAAPDVGRILAALSFVRRMDFPSPPIGCGKGL